MCRRQIAAAAAPNGAVTIAPLALLGRLRTEEPRWPRCVWPGTAGRPESHRGVTRYLTDALIAIRAPDVSDRPLEHQSCVRWCGSRGMTPEGNQVDEAAPEPRRTHLSSV